MQLLLNLLTSIINFFRLPTNALTTLPSWLAVVYVLIAPASASAHTASISIDHIDPPNLLVSSQNYAYTQLENSGDVYLWVNINIVPNSGSVVGNVYIDPRIISSFRDRTEASRFTFSKNYDERTNSLHETVKIFIPRYALAQFAINECDKNKALMLRNGNRADDIFARDQTLPVTISLSGSWNTPGRRPSDAHPFPDLEKFRALLITCKASSGTGAVTSPADDTHYLVKKASIQTRPITQTDGTCEIAAQVGISTNRPNSPVYYQLWSPLGDNGQRYELTTDQNGDAIANHKFKVANKAGTSTGAMQVHGNFPHSFLSNTATYSINCPIGHGLKPKVIRPEPSRVIPKNEKLKAPGITPLSGVSQREKPKVPGIISPPSIPQNKSPESKLPKNNFPENNSP